MPLQFSRDLDAHNPNTPEWREDIGLVVTRLLSKVPPALSRRSLPSTCGASENGSPRAPGRGEEGRGGAKGWGGAELVEPSPGDPAFRLAALCLGAPAGLCVTGSWSASSQGRGRPTPPCTWSSTSYLHRTQSLSSDGPESP